MFLRNEDYVSKWGLKYPKWFLNDTFLCICTIDLKEKRKGVGNEKSLGIVDTYSFAKEKDKENIFKNHFTTGKNQETNSSEFL